MPQQHDLDLANQIGAAFRADLNLALKAISAKQWGSSAPPTLLPYLEWADSTAPSTPVIKIYDGASWLVMATIDATNHIWQPVIGGGISTLASAGTTDLGSVAGSGVDVTGTTGITSFGSSVAKGVIKRLRFAASLTITYNATSMLLPGNKNLTVQAGDTMLVEHQGSGNWRALMYQSAGTLPSAGLGTEATLASASTTDLGSVASNIVSITGTTGITSFGSSANAASPLYFVRFSGALTLTHNGTSLILPGAANIVVAAGDSAVAQYLGSGNWKVIGYLPAVGYARSDRATVWTKTQAGAYNTLTDAATVAVDLSLGNNHVVTLAGNRALGAPSNMTPGASGIINLVQDATGGRTLSFASAYYFAGGVDPVLSTAANALDVLAYTVAPSGTVLYCTFIKGLA